MKDMKKHLTQTFLPLLLFAGLLLPAPAKAQIQEVKQTVFGMDCAPCAYGLEKRFKSIDGVASARVSLNEGFAEVRLEPGSRVTLETIRDAVRESGFSPREATLRATGMLQQKGDQWILTLAGGERFLLVPADDQPDVYRRLEEGRVTVTGRVTKDDTKDQEPLRDAYALELLSLDGSA